MFFTRRKAFSDYNNMVYEQVSLIQKPPQRLVFWAGYIRPRVWAIVSVEVMNIYGVTPHSSD